MWSDWPDKDSDRTFADGSPSPALALSWLTTSGQSRGVRSPSAFTSQKKGDAPVGSGVWKTPFEP